jgi:O-methyltransferase
MGLNILTRIVKKMANNIGFEITRSQKEAKNKVENDYLLLPKIGLTYANDLLYTYHNADFLKDTHFIESYNLGKQTDGGKLLKDYDIQWRIHVLCWAAYHASHLEGDFVDCGVHTGIFARSIVQFIKFEETGKKYYLLDTFKGMDPKYSNERELERHKLMDYDNRDEDALYDQVKETFKNYNVEIIKGSVPETLPLVTSDKICFLSIDMNCVEPEVRALEYFWDRMVPGGMILLDDYGYANSSNDQKEAHDEFARSKGVMVLTLPTCQGLIVKP